MNKTNLIWATLLASLISLAGPNARALELDGCWISRDAVMIDHDGVETGCPSGIYLHIHQSKKMFQLTVIDYDCAHTVATSQLEFPMSIQDGKLLRDGKPVGSISEDEISFSVIDQARERDLTIVDQLTWKKTTGPAPVAFNHELSLNGKHFVTVKGNLSLAQCQE